MSQFRKLTSIFAFCGTVIFLCVGFSPIAVALTVNPSSTPVVDFGGVAVGSHASATLTISYQTDPGETVDTVDSLISYGPGIFSANITDASCKGNPPSGNSCTWSLSFAPLATGIQVAFLLNTLKIYYHIDAGNMAAYVDVILRGTGLSPTPLPATLPLFATGLGALGLLGWRRKRKAAALAA